MVPATTKKVLSQRRRRFGVASALFVVMLVGVAFVVQSRWFTHEVATRVQRSIAQATGLDVRVDGVSFSLWNFAVRVEGIEVQRPGAPRIARIRSLMVAPSPQDIVRGRVHLSRVSIDGADVDLRFEEHEGRLVLANGPVLSGQGASGGSGELPFRDIDVTDLRMKARHPTLGEVSLEAVDFDVLHTPERRLMIGVLASSGEVHSARFTGPIRRLEARVSIDQTDGDVRVALAHVGLGRLSVHVRDGTWSPRHHRIDLDARVEAHVEDVLGVLPTHPDIRGEVAVDVRGWGNLDTQAVEAEAAVDARDLSLNVIDRDTHETLRYSLGDRIHLRADVTRDRVVARDFRASWAAAEITSPAVTLGLREGFPLTGDLLVRDMDFTRIMSDTSVTRHTIVLWTISGPLRLHGALDPLRLVFDMQGMDTRDFAVLRDGWDRLPQRPLIRLARARVEGRMIIDDESIGWYDMTATLPRSRVTARRVRVRTSRDLTGRDKDIQIEGVSSEHIDLADLGTVADLPIRGIARMTTRVWGDNSDPIVTGTLHVDNFVFNTFPLGTLETAAGTEWRLRGLRVEAPRITGHHRRSNYELTNAYLDFTRWSLAAGARLRSERFQVRDFYNMFHFEGDPAFEPYDGSSAADAQIDFVLGRPGDDRDGVMTVNATLARGQITAFGERIDDVGANVAYEWFNRRLGVRGARASVDFRGTKGGAPVEASGGIDPGARLHFVASARAVPLRAMDLLRTSEVPVNGLASVSVSVEGTPDAPRVLADVTLRELSALGRSLGAVDLRVAQIPEGPPLRVLGDRPPIGRLTLDTRLLEDRVRVHAALRVPWDEGRWRDAVGVEHRDYGRAWGRAELAATVATTDAVDVLPWLPPTVLARAGEGATARARFSAVIERATLNALSHADARLVVDALELRATGLAAELGSGAPLVACARDGAFWMAPPNARESCGATPARFVSSASETAASTPDFDLARPLLIGPGGVRVWIDGGGVIGDERAPTRLEGNVRAELDLARAAALVPSLTWGRGVGVLAANVAWDGEQPNLAGSLQLHNAALGAAGLPNPVSGVDLDLRLRGNGITVERARASYGAATVDASGGSVQFERTHLERVTIPLRVRNLVMTSRDGLPDGMELGLDADLTLTRGGAGEPVALAGDVTITRGRFTRPVYLSSDLGARLFGNAPAAGAATGPSSGGDAAPYDPARDWLSLDVRVHMPTTFRVANNLLDADVRLGSGRAFNVVGTNQRYGLLGTIEVPRGVIHINETDFEIRRARIEFDNPERIAPTFDLLAQTEIRRAADTNVRSQWRVALHAYGNPEHVSLDWSADPSLSLEDIVLLLFFRLTRAEMERVGGVNAAGAVGIEVLSRGIGLDRLTQRIPFIDDVRPGSMYNFRSGVIEPSLSVGGRVTEWLRWGGLFTFSAQPLLHAGLDVRLGRAVSVQVFLNNATNQPSTQTPNVGFDLRWRLSR